VSQQEDPDASRSPSTLDAPYCGNSRSHKLHRKGCDNIEKTNPAFRMPFHSEAEALTAGYTLGGCCR
jgi:hypothetical protein